MSREKNSFSLHPFMGSLCKFTDQGFRVFPIDAGIGDGLIRVRSSRSLKSLFYLKIGKAVVGKKKKLPSLISAMDFGNIKIYHSLRLPNGNNIFLAKCGIGPRFDPVGSFRNIFNFKLPFFCG